MAVKTKFKVTVPEEIQEVITSLGYTVMDWMKLQLQGLLAGVKQAKINDLIKDKTAEIDAHQLNVKNKIKVEEVV